MLENEREQFFALVSDVHAFYRVECTPFALGVWWEAFKHFDLLAVRGAMNRHAVNPDNGQFVPKPADIVKLIGGTSQDSALIAWSKAEKAIRSVGPYRSVVFDDALIHAVVSDMGGWSELTSVSEKELPFKAKEFENRYRGYKTAGGVESYPPRLICLAEMTNSCSGQRIDPPVLIGNPDKARAVLNGGVDRPLQITMAHANDFIRLGQDDEEREAA